jgi:hypothetical protein
MILFVSSEIHCKGNKSQEIVSLMETVLMSTERGRDSKKKRASQNRLR